MMDCMKGYLMIVVKEFLHQAAVCAGGCSKPSGRDVAPVGVLVTIRDAANTTIGQCGDCIVMGYYNELRDVLGS